MLPVTSVFFSLPSSVTLTIVSQLQILSQPKWRCSVMCFWPVFGLVWWRGRCSGGDTVPAFLNPSRHKKQWRWFSSWCLPSQNSITPIGRPVCKGAFTRVPQVDQRSWINQSEPCKQFLSTEVINGVDGWTSWRWQTFVQRRWFTLGDSPQITRLCLVSLRMVLLLIIIRKTVLETSLNDFYTFLELHLSIQLTMCLMHLMCYVSLSTA